MYSLLMECSTNSLEKLWANKWNWIKKKTIKERKKNLIFVRHVCISLISFFFFSFSFFSVLFCWEWWLVAAAEWSIPCPSLDNIPLPDGAQPARLRDRKKPTVCPPGSVTWDQHPCPHLNWWPTYHLQHGWCAFAKHQVQWYKDSDFIDSFTWRQQFLFLLLFLFFLLLQNSCW